MRELQQILAAFELDFDLTAFSSTAREWCSPHLRRRDYQRHHRRPAARIRIPQKISTRAVWKLVVQYNGQETLPRHPLHRRSRLVSHRKDTPSLRNHSSHCALEGHPRRGVHHHPDPAAGFGPSRYDKFMTLFACGQTHRAHELGTLQCHPVETLGTASRIHVRRGPLQTHQRYRGTFGAMKSLPVWGIRLRKSSVRPVAWPAGAGRIRHFIDAPGDAEET